MPPRSSDQQLCNEMRSGKPPEWLAVVQKRAHGVSASGPAAALGSAARILTGENWLESLPFSMMKSKNNGIRFVRRRSGE